MVIPSAIVPVAKSQPNSNLAIASRYVLQTDAIAQMCEEGRRALASNLPASDRRYDIGNFQSYFETFVEFAFADPQYGVDFRRFLEKTLGKQCAVSQPA